MSGDQPISCRTGSWGIALIIFVASIVVPLAKLIVLERAD